MLAFQYVGGPFTPFRGFLEIGTEAHLILHIITMTTKLSRISSCTCTTLE